MKKALAYILVLASLLTGCDKWYTTEDISHVSYLPKFNLIGGEFISIRRSDTANFTDPGCTAESNGTELTVYYLGEVVDSVVGVYIIKYFATNPDGLSSEAERIVAVTEYDVSNNNLSGTYNTDLFGEKATSKVKIIDTAGFYECDDVMGYPGFKMPGRFVDLGDNQLILLHGEGYFGKYAAAEGTYSRSTLSWIVHLLDPPNTGIEIPVLWRKTD